MIDFKNWATNLGRKYRHSVNRLRSWVRVLSQKQSNDNGKRHKQSRIREEIRHGSELYGIFSRAEMGQRLRVQSLWARYGLQGQEALPKAL